MMLLPGAMRGLPISAVLISYRIARSPTLSSKMEHVLVLKPLVAQSTLVKLALRLPDQLAVLWQKPGYAFPLKVMFYKPLLARG